MKNTFSQSGNDSKWFLKKSFFKIGKWHSRPPRDPPPFMANAILNFHFDFLTPSLTANILLLGTLLLLSHHLPFSAKFYPSPISCLPSCSETNFVVFFQFKSTRSFAALRAADLDWIVGPGYSLGRVHSGEKP